MRNASYSATGVEGKSGGRLCARSAEEDGVGCVSCHGRVDRMEVVEQVEALSMGWCLDCHRDPDPHLRPK